ncbi:hypothetical protein EQO05_02605 [Methanosarcina sp. MSH10X1]|uniref:hypothetical protein n=1 Tax=Methanosarcina sp. MSH10X1 TaxID=2507075 RepID=UPI000FFCC39B|nr:hypothetical protein [Methanosarcina sp. MSH10X1]RXA21332.1 hypothetical protein EQO05_02605 [Methanosarcina sp. MSH10X1]
MNTYPFFIQKITVKINKIVVKYIFEKLAINNSSIIFFSVFRLQIFIFWGVKFMGLINRKSRLAMISIITTLAILSLASQAMAAASSKEYTLNADFDEGTFVGVEHDTVADQLQLSKEATTLPFIWVPNSNEGTVSKYDTVTGKELARYWTGPNSNGNPSRTTVDLDGSVWFGNRNTGTVVKIVLPESGKWVDKNGNGVCDTSQDTDNDGTIESGEVLPWGQDDCVVHEVPVGSRWSGPRGIAIDSDNNLWAGTYSDSSNKFYHINGETGAIFDTIDIGYGSYGALIDENGNIWSSTLSTCVLKIDPSTKNVQEINIPSTSYGIGIDKNGHVFVAGWGSGIITKIDAVQGTIINTASQGDAYSRGVAVTDEGDVWIANTDKCDVTRLDNDLNFKATIDVGSGVMTTGVAVDAEGKVWACNYNDGSIYRINPDDNSAELITRTPGISGGFGQHYSYSDMTGIIARTVTTKIGTWTVDFDSEASDMSWGTVSWNSNEPTGTSIEVKVRSSNDGNTWSAWEIATKDNSLSSTPAGRYLQVETKLQITSGDESPILYDLTVKVGNQPPVANAGADQTVEQANLAGTEVTLDGSGSTDDGLISPLTYDWTWNGDDECDWKDKCDWESNGESAIGEKPVVTLPLGTTAVTLTVFDGQFSSTDTVDITVRDTTAPTITASGDPKVLWPPNHKYETISISDFVTSVTDICDASVGVDKIMITSVSSDEPEEALGEGDGNTMEDIVIKDSQTVDLRAERQGDGNGRVYTINYLVTDTSGNTATRSYQVWVPHDQGNGATAVDDGAAAGYIVNYPE